MAIVIFPCLILNPTTPFCCKVKAILVLDFTRCQALERKLCSQGLAVQGRVVRDVFPDNAGRTWQRIQTLDGSILAGSQLGIQTLVA